MRTVIFVDGANLSQSLSMLNKKVDFLGLETHYSNYIDKQIQQPQIRYYTAVTRDDSGLNNLQKFMDWLTYHGVIVVQKEAKIMTRPDGTAFTKGNMDIEIVLDSLACLPWADKFIYFTGDEDFTPLFRHLRSLGKHITLISTQDCDNHVSHNANVVASGLRKECDQFVNMNDNGHSPVWSKFLKSYPTNSD